MRKTIIAVMAVSAITGAAAGSMVQLAVAQQATPPAQVGGPAEGDGGPHGGWGPHPGWGHWFHHMREGRLHALRTFGLFYHVADRQLTSADVQKIAEALLLWHGNHTWKVTGVTENSDNTIGFAYSAPDGTVIAKFAIDRKTGHFERVG